MVSAPTGVLRQVWKVINVDTMRGHLTGHVETNAVIWQAIEQGVRRLVRAGLIADPTDADHAMALEREAIASFVESVIIEPATVNVEHRIDGTRILHWRVRVLEYEPDELIDAIRDGAHNMPRPGRETGEARE